MPVKGATGAIDAAGARPVFATTQWSVVVSAQGDSAEARAALEILCRTYWRSIFSFIRCEGRSVEDSQDLTQGFFELLLERRDLEMVRQEKGRLRSYLLVALKHYLAQERRRANAIKRGAGKLHISLEELVSREQHDPEPAELLTADRIYERRWALTLLDQVLLRLGHEYALDGKTALFDHFKKLLADESDGQSQAQIAAELNMSENAVKQAYLRFRRAYRDLLREEIARTVALPGDVEDELHQLIQVLRA